jgi:hypothetical protein
MDFSHDDQARHDQVRALAAIIIDAERGDSPEAPMAQRLHAAVLRTEQILKGLLGELGTRALIARAFHLSGGTRPLGASATSPEAPSVMAIAHWQDSVAQYGDAHARQEAEKLLAHALTLLCDFIGSDLTFRVFNRSYPAFRAQRIGHDPSEGS